MNFGQLIKYNMKNIFLEKSFTKVVEKLLPDPFLKNQIEHISESISKSLMQFVYVVFQVEGYQNILKLSCRPLVFTSYKAFLKNKTWFRTSLFGSLCYIFLTDQISLSGCL